MTIELEPIERQLAELRHNQERSESEQLKGRKQTHVGTVLATVGVTVAVLALVFAVVRQGRQGDKGLACWDKNANGKCDLKLEDINKDKVCDIIDCRGPVGPPNNVPIGAIIAWNKNPAASSDGKNPGPSLELNQPDSPMLWAECNGPATSDDLSTPFDETKIPELNKSQRFLRGGTQSGERENDATKLPADLRFNVKVSGNHVHRFQSDPEVRLVVNGNENDKTKIRPDSVRDGGAIPREWAQFVKPDIQKSGQHNHLITATGGSSETRPKNMSVVWIIRVK